MCKPLLQPVALGRSHQAVLAFTLKSSLEAVEVVLVAINLAQVALEVRVAAVLWPVEFMMPPLCLQH